MRGPRTPIIEESRCALREVSSMTCNENFEKLSSAQHAYCIWLCWLLVRKIDIDRLAIFPLHRIDYFPFSKLDYRNKLNTPIGRKVNV